MEVEEEQIGSSSSANGTESSRKEEEEEEKGEEKEEQNQHQNQNVLRFLDSMDSYLILRDSLSSTLRQGWLELASARHSMGASRINSALFDLKDHCAATSLEVVNCDAGSTMEQPHLTLNKWATPGNQNFCSGEAKLEEDDLIQRKSSGPQLRHRGASLYPEIQEKRPKRNQPESNGSPLKVDDEVQKERSKSLSMFGALVSPKLRASQLSFESALETLVEIANLRSSMLCACVQVQKDIESTMG